jgi:hypothetical protein
VIGYCAVPLLDDDGCLLGAVEAEAVCEEWCMRAHTHTHALTKFVQSGGSVPHARDASGGGLRDLGVLPVCLQARVCVRE